jgi:hypothetical protein
MNSYPPLTDDTSQFPTLRTVRTTLPVHAQHQQGRLCRCRCQWRMPIRNYCSGVNHHINFQRSLKSYRNLMSVPQS